MPRRHQDLFLNPKFRGCGYLHGATGFGGFKDLGSGLGPRVLEFVSSAGVSKN